MEILTEHRTRMWRVISAKKGIWMTVDIARISNVPLVDAKTYCAWLVEKKYILERGNGYHTPYSAQRIRSAPNPSGIEIVTTVWRLEIGKKPELLSKNEEENQKVMDALGVRVPRGNRKVVAAKTKRDAMWAALGKLEGEVRDFSKHDLALLAGVSDESAHDYIRVLRRHGYLDMEQAHSGAPGRYRLAVSWTEERPHTSDIRKVNGVQPKEASRA